MPLISEILTHVVRLEPKRKDAIYKHPEPQALNPEVREISTSDLKPKGK